jgi:hypothetical protein
VTKAVIHYNSTSIQAIKVGLVSLTYISKVVYVLKISDLYLEEWLKFQGATFGHYNNSLLKLIVVIHSSIYQRFFYE